MTYENLINDKIALENQIINIKKRLSALPEGKIIFCRNGKYERWYWSKKGIIKPIPKKDLELASKLALKKYLDSKLKYVQHKLDAINICMKYYPREIYTPSTEFTSYAKLVSDNYKDVTGSLEWGSKEFASNPLFPEQCIYKSLSGHALRSKSEMMIDTALFASRLPFRYECELVLNGGVCYPDFTIMNPEDGKIWYWEHLGMMDAPEYVKKAIDKLKKYFTNGLIPGYNLILTFESSDSPLDFETVNFTIKQYFGRDSI